MFLGLGILSLLAQLKGMATRYMEVVYRLNEKDLLTGMRFMESVSPLAKRVYGTAILFIFLLPCFLFVVTVLAKRQLTLYNIVDLVIQLLLIALVVVLVKKLVTPILHRHIVAEFKKSNLGVLEESKISLEEDAIVASSPVVESRLGWSGVTGVHQNENYIVIMIANQQGYIIPKRAFASDEAVNQFYNQANEFYQRSQRI